MSSWYNSQGSNSDVVLSSKIRILRNLADAPFPCKMPNELRKGVCKRIFASIKNSSLAGEFEMTELNQLREVEKIALAEKGIIRPDTARSANYTCLISSRDESVSMLLCEEEHIKLSSMASGQNLEAAYEKANEIDDILIDSLKIAFNERLGFLTSNPMNIGTGMKASLVLHLPAIYSKGMLPSLTNMVGKLGFNIRALFGGESGFYELSNRITLGITEKSAIDNLNAICDQIVRQERALRQELASYDEFEDRIFRAMGTLKMARKLTSKEMYSLISLVRLGISMGNFDDNYDEIGNMLYTLGTASIISTCDDGMTADDADKYRAKYVREKLK